MLWAIKMISKKMKLIFLSLLVVLTCIAMVSFSNFILFTLVYIFIFLFISLRTLLRGTDRIRQLFVIVVFAGIMVIELVFNILIVFDPGNSPAFFVFGKIIGSLLVFSPFVVERFIVVTKYDYYDFPSITDSNTISYSDSLRYGGKIAESINSLKSAKEKISSDDILQIVKDFPRHSSFRYVNRNSLSQEYFDKAVKTIDDEHIYIVLSNTGSAASEIISVFTKKMYNHVSVSFDRDLETIISYNGGENVYPPGLNPEMIEWFNKKDDASIIVYAMEVSKEKKRLLIDKVADINKAGNAYNMLGLVLKFSVKPNILFCSQFLYRLLEFAEINFFTKEDGQVRPTDFVELDYYRKLMFSYEIKFNYACLSENR